MGVRTEVASSFASRFADHRCAREHFGDSQGQVRVGLIVAVLDVEAWVVLLDPRELQGERLDFVRDHDPIHTVGRCQH